MMRNARTLSFVFVFLVMLTVSCGRQPERVVASSEQPKPNLVIVEFFKNHPLIDDFWVIKTPPMGGRDTKLLTQLGNDARNETAKIELAIQQYSSVNPLTMEIAAQFPNLKRMIYLRNGNVVQPGLTEEEIEKAGFKLLFLPGDQLMGDEHPSSVYYEHRFGAVMIAALRWPEPVIAGLAFHELGHALRHSQGATSATAPANSDWFIAEEVEMHELETEVLDAATAKGYTKWLDKVLARNPDVSPLSLMYRVTMAEWQELDTLLRSNRCGRYVASHVISQATVALAFRSIDQRSAGSAREKIKAYRQITREPLFK